jgi:hypothetical protein
VPVHDGVLGNCKLFDARKESQAAGIVYASCWGCDALVLGEADAQGFYIAQVVAHLLHVFKEGVEGCRNGIIFTDNGEFLAKSLIVVTRIDVCVCTVPELNCIDEFNFQALGNGTLP